MKIGVAAMENSLDAEVSKRFARCPWFLIVNSEDLSFEGFNNPAADMAGGSGPAAVQELSSRGVQVAVAGEFGPKAVQAMQAAGIRPVDASGKIRDALAGLEL